MTGVYNMPPGERQASGLYRALTTLHGYPLEGPCQPAPNQVWYCDNRVCRYTRHGVYAKYRIPLWRSVNFGSGFVLCDGCVREYSQTNNAQPQSGPINVTVTVKPQQSMEQVIPAQQNQMPPPAFYDPSVAMANNNMGGGFTDSNVTMQLNQNVSNNSGEIIKAAQPNNDNTTAPSNINQMPPTQQSQQSQTQIPQSSDNNNNTPPKVLKQGWMMKKGGLVQNWKKRYFKLHSDKQLFYYETDKTASTKGVAQLYNVKVVTKIGKQSLEIVTGQRTWVFACQNAEERDSWVNAIAALCKAPVG